GSGTAAGRVGPRTPRGSPPAHPAGCTGPGGSAAPVGRAPPPAAFPAAGDGMAPSRRCPGRVGSFAVRPPPGRLAGRSFRAAQTGARAVVARGLARILATHWLAMSLATGSHAQDMPDAGRRLLGGRR